MKTEIDSTSGFARETIRALDRNLPTIISPNSAKKIEGDYRKGKRFFDLEKQAKINDALTEGKISQHEADMLKRQYRAGCFLYERRDDLAGDSNTNPLTDSLVYTVSGLQESDIPNRAFLVSPEHFTLCARGDPVAGEYLTLKNPVKYRQRAQLKDIDGKTKTFRTVWGFGDYMTPTVRGLYLWAEMAKADPEAITEAIGDYNKVATNNLTTNAGTALGILEIINNARLLEDDRFADLIDNLRGIVMKEAHTYDELRQEFQYQLTVMDTYKPFWVEGEIKQAQLEERSSDRRTHLKDASEAQGVEFPTTDGWDAMTRRRNADSEEVENLKKTYEVLTEQLSHGNGDWVMRTIKELVSNKRRAAELIARNRRTEKLYKSHLTEGWKRVLAPFQLGRAPTDSEIKSVDEVSRRLINYFKNDSNISHAVSAMHEDYGIKAEILAASPLVNWVLSLKDRETADKIRRSVEEQPQSFCLLLKSMVDEVSHASFARVQGEKDFLFDYQYMNRAEANPESLVKIYDELVNIVKINRPDLNQIFQSVLASEYKDVAELLAIPRPSGRFDAIKKRVEGWELGGSMTKSAKLIPPFRDKSSAFTRRDFLKIAGTIGLAVGLEELTFGRLGIFDSIFSGRHYLYDLSEQTSLETLNKEERLNLRPQRYARIYQLPQGMNLSNGDELAYFINRWNYRLEFRGLINDYFKTFENTQTVDKLELSKLTFGPDQLVLSLDKNDGLGFIYPPLGWKFVRIIQTEGVKPVTDTYGRIAYTTRHGMEWPDQSLFVLERSDPNFDYTKMVNRIVEMPGEKYDTYTHFYNYEEAVPTNKLLAPDPILQDLHHEFITELERVQDDPVKASDAVLKYLGMFSSYIDTNRFYALNFRTDPNIDPNYGALANIARKKDSGFYCDVAAWATYDFLSSAGITAIVQPGFPTKYYEHGAWFKFAHANTVAFLPDGRKIVIDNTPGIVEGKTPREDIDYLKEEDPSFIDLHKDEIIDLSLKIGGGAAAATGIGYATMKYVIPGIKEVQMNRYLKDALYENDYIKGGAELELRLSVRDTLIRLPYGPHFQKQAAEILDILTRYDPERHGNIIGILTSSEVGIAYLNLKNAGDAYGHAKTAGLVGELSNGEFTIAYQLAGMLHQAKKRSFTREVAEGIFEGNEKSNAADLKLSMYKVKEIRDMVIDMLRGGEVQKENVALMAKFYHDVSGLGNALENELRNITDTGLQPPFDIKTLSDLANPDIPMAQRELLLTVYKTQQQLVNEFNEGRITADEFIERLEVLYKDLYPELYTQVSGGSEDYGQYMMVLDDGAYGEIYSILIGQLTDDRNSGQLNKEEYSRELHVLEDIDERRRKYRRYGKKGNN